MRRPDFFVSDTHFGHHNIIKFEPEKRPFASIEEHDAELVKRWNAKVGPNDLVLHCGDVFFGQGHQVLRRLNGEKWLVLGNHDQYNWKHYQGHFTQFMGVYDNRDGLVFTHIPIHESAIERRWKFNVHGHEHSLPPRSARHINISIENTGLAPISYRELRDLVD